MSEPRLWCEHHECRCFAAAKLAAMGRTAEAIEVHGAKVTCIKGARDAWASGAIERPDGSRA